MLSGGDNDQTVPGDMDITSGDQSARAGQSLSCLSQQGGSKSASVDVTTETGPSNDRSSGCDVYSDPERSAQGS